MGNTVNEILLGKLLDIFFQQKAIVVPADFHSQCGCVKNMLNNDITGMVSTTTTYAVDSASEAQYKIVCKNKTLQTLLNKWIENINQSLKGKVPSGINPLAEEYFKELWQGSSFCVLRAQQWEQIEYKGTKIEVPNVLVLLKGSSIYTNETNDTELKLGSTIYKLGNNSKTELISSDKMSYIFQKPLARWTDIYPTPYLIKSGVYKNFLTVQILQDKGDEIITKILPYLLLIKRGSPELFAKGQRISDGDLKEMNQKMDDALARYKEQRNKVPTMTAPFDTELEHFIPDFAKVLKVDLFEQSQRAILNGLGFVDVIQGISDSRKESVLNPKPFIAKVNKGVRNFESLLLEVIKLIVERNSAHIKFFNESNFVKVVHSPLRINVEAILTDLRSAYDRGLFSIETYHEMLGVDHETEATRRTQEYNDGKESIFYPHMIQNTEKDTDDRPGIPTKPVNERTEDMNKKKNSPESLNYKNASLVASSQNYIINMEARDKFENLTSYIYPGAKDIKIVVGINKENKKQEICEILFSKNNWNESTIENWLEEKNMQLNYFAEFASLSKETIMAPYTEDNYPKYLNKYPEGARKTFIETFNKVLNDSNGDEEKSYKIAWTALKRWMKKHGYKKVGDKWEKV